MVAAVAAAGAAESNAELVVVYVRQALTKRHITSSLKTQLWISQYLHMVITDEMCIVQHGIGNYTC
jgi:hypothetical protein